MEILHYTLPSGRVPVEDYLDGLDIKLRAKTLRTILLLQKYGPMLREPESKHLSDGIFELRTTFGGNTGRVLYFFFHEGKVVITHGFVKKSRKTPKEEIDRAKRYRADYLERFGG